MDGCTLPPTQPNIRYTRGPMLSKKTLIAIALVIGTLAVLWPRRAAHPPTNTFDTETANATETRPSSKTPDRQPANSPHASPSEQPGDTKSIHDTSIHDKPIHDTSIWVEGPRGKTNIAPTLTRIRRGKRHPHRRDGSTFYNREKRLPLKPRGYYKEYVHPTRGMRGPGPQRIVIGRNGETYYTADHYRTFEKIPEQVAKGGLP